VSYHICFIQFLGTFSNVKSTARPAMQSSSGREKFMLTLQVGSSLASREESAYLSTGAYYARGRAAG
jgi:hypothetical protein